MHELYDQVEEHRATKGILFSIGMGVITQALILALYLLLQFE